MAHGKHRLHKEMLEIFSARRAKREQDQEVLPAQLYQQVGQRKVSVDGLKKKQDMPPEAKRELLEPSHPQMSVARQCDLVGCHTQPTMTTLRGRVQKISI